MSLQLSDIIYNGICKGDKNNKGSVKSMLKI